MKKLIYLFTILLIISCSQVVEKRERPKIKCPYQDGDIIYLKPDSTQMVITYAEDCTYNPHYYHGNYFDKWGKQQFTMVKESQIFGKKK